MRATDLLARSIAPRIKRNHTSGNILQNGFHELPPAFQLLHRLLEVGSELIDLRAAVTQLRGHRVEGAHQDAQLILRLFRTW